MKKFNLIFFVFAFLFLTSKVSSQTYNPFIEGFWYGVLEFQGSELILTFEIKKNEKDSLRGMFNSPLQNANNIPITRIEAKNDSLQIFVKSLGANIKGVLAEKDSLLDAVFTQAIFKIPIKFKKTTELFSLKRPQEPKPPFKYTEEEISFENTKAGIKLAGSLTYPHGDGPFPAVILISGSGPQDRNEEIFGHKPFWVIADYFSNNGFAVLRFDDRGMGKSGGTFQTATSMDFSTDVEAAITFLRAHSKINPQKIGLLGHSEGGMIAPIIAAKDKEIKFIILLAGPGITGEQILLTQIHKMLELDENDPAFIKRIMTDSKKTYKILKKNPNPKKASDALRKYFTKRAKEIPENEQIDYGYLKSSVEAKIQALNSPWFRYFLTFNPEDYLRNVNCPVFALYGDKDVQILSAENSIALQKIAKKYDKKDFILKIYKGKNHLFQNADNGTITEYALIEETICPVVLNDLLLWIIEKSK